jgi:hypothetical protein
MTPAERKARERERKRAAGLVPVEVWVKVSKKTELEAAVRRINSVDTQDNDGHIAGDCRT